MSRRLIQIDTALAYHARTKHRLEGFAASPGYLDWDNQPDPFRTFSGCEHIPLPLLPETPLTSYADLYVPGRIAPARLDSAGVGLLLELSLGLSAWKEYGSSRWALRCNPSSGNLHPTEGYVVLPAMDGLERGGVFHYLSRDHCLERRAVLHQSSLPENTILIGLSSVHWREAWKYGERAFRYCQHDLGHAIAAVRYAAATLGWSARLLVDATDPEVAAVLGLTRAEAFGALASGDREHPGVLLEVAAGPADEPTNLSRLATALSQAVWTGTANALSARHVSWPVIDEVARATWLEEAVSGTRAGVGDPPADDPRPLAEVGAGRILRQRRSAVAFDETTSISEETFYGMLDRLMPRHRVPPWDLWPWPPLVHPVIFVHRVNGLSSGLYLFERSAAAEAGLRSVLRPDFAFERPETCPSHLRLFRLASGDFRPQAEIVSCRQRIAAAGAFSLGMLAEFGGSLRSRGAWWYRRLFWEAGLLGHVLYLEAEAAGVRGTGIGCYFDDTFHSLLGIQGDEFQSLYHFTIGGPVEDTRLTTRPGYDPARRVTRHP